MRLDDEGRITVFVVSPDFQGMSAFDRQVFLDEVLNKPSTAHTPDDRRRVLMIAGLTPAEYDSVGSRIRVHKVKEVREGTIEVLVHGGLSDAEYVRGALKGEKGVKTTEPKQVPGAVGILMKFRATSTASQPLTKARAMRILESDQYIEVMPNA
jgi:hypothetical protein